MIKVINHHYREPKKLLGRNKLVDTYFVSKHGFSPYMACQHACKYCDGRAEKYYVQGDFEKDIVIRKNASILLETELPKLREKGTILIGSGISDPYQPIEENEKIMQQCLNVLKEFDFSVSIMTKSALILRDIDLWEKINKKNPVTLMVSLTFSDDEPRKIFEPFASTVDDRLKTLCEFKKRGMKIGVLAMPFIPFVSLNEKNISSLFNKLKNLDIDFVLPGDLTLRPGRQKDLFFHTIKKHYPHLLKKFEELYIENRPSGAPISSFSNGFYRKTQNILNELAISDLIPHYVYKNSFPIYDEIYILLKHMISLYTKKGVNTSNLLQAVNRYEDWLKKEKTIFNRRRCISQNDLENKFLSTINLGEMQNILKNDRLENFIKNIVFDGKIFDYEKLSMIYTHDI